MRGARLLAVHLMKTGGSLKRRAPAARARSGAPRSRPLGSLACATSAITFLARSNQRNGRYTMRRGSWRSAWSTYPRIGRLLRGATRLPLRRPRASHFAAAVAGLPGQRGGAGSRARWLAPPDRSRLILRQRKRQCFLFVASRRPRGRRRSCRQIERGPASADRRGDTAGDLRTRATSERG